MTEQTTCKYADSVEAMKCQRIEQCDDCFTIDHLKECDGCKEYDHPELVKELIGRTIAKINQKL